MLIKKIILSLFLCVSCCHDIVEDISNHLATKTPYRVIANYKSGNYTFSDCTPVKLWMMIRHGTRYPGRKDIHFLNDELPIIRNEVLQNHARGKGKLNEKQLEDFRVWAVRVNSDEEKHLQHEGEEEMIDLAERMQSRFPSLLPEKYDNSTFRFRYTATQRTQQSAVNFATGLFGRQNAMDVWYPAAGTSDIVLRSYKMCKRWLTDIKKNPETLFEQKMFGKSELMLKSIREVSDKLGFDKSIPLSTAYKMYKICAFETAWLKKIHSPWCHSFDIRNIKVFEYYDDLKYYWIDGYGNSLTARTSCPVAKDFMEHLLSDEDPVVSISFSHSGTILKILAHLNLWRPDEHLSHKYIDHQRPWKVSKMDAFASNIALTRYRCETGNDYIVALHQERPVLLPGCRNILCPVKTIKNYFYDSLNKCDFHEMCNSH